MPGGLVLELLLVPALVGVAVSGAAALLLVIAGTVAAGQFPDVRVRDLIGLYLLELWPWAVVLGLFSWSASFVAGLIWRVLILGAR